MTLRLLSIAASFFVVGWAQPFPPISGNHDDPTENVRDSLFLQRRRLYFTDGASVVNTSLPSAR